MKKEVFNNFNRKGSKGHPQTKETREKISKGVKKLYQNGLKIPSVHMPGVREKISLTLKGKPFMPKPSRLGCAPWNKGMGDRPLATRIRSSSQYQKWRKSVFERDNWTCQFCGERGRKLAVDHIKSFAQTLREFIKSNSSLKGEDLLALALLDMRFWDLDNARVLCYNCHSKTDTFCGGSFKDK